MNFKTWRDAYLFLEKYATCSCLNCRHHQELDPEKEHKEYEYARFFCPVTVAMVDLAFTTVCKEWENNNGDILLNYMNKNEWKLSDEEIEKLSSDKDKKWEFEEILEVLNHE